MAETQKGKCYFASVPGGAENKRNIKLEKSFVHFISCIIAVAASEEAARQY